MARAKKKTPKRKAPKKTVTVTTMSTTKTTRTVRKANPAQAYDVYLRGKKIDTVFYSPGAKVSADDVKRSLVSHDGYDADIVVKKARSKKAKKSNVARKSNPIERGTKAWYRRNLILPVEAGDASDVNVIDTLYSWHGGQDSAVYSLASTGSDDYVSASMIDRALTELEQDLREAKGVSKKDKRDLGTVIDELSGVLGYPEEYTTEEYTGEDKDSGYDEYGLRIDEIEGNPPRMPKRGKHKMKRRPKSKKNPDVSWPTLREAQQATALEFTPALAKRHHFVKSSNGRWYRTLGPPDPKGLTQVRDRVWHQSTSKRNNPVATREANPKIDRAATTPQIRAIAARLAEGG